MGDQETLPALGQLDDSVDASGVNGQGAHEDDHWEVVEKAALSDMGVSRVKHVVLVQCVEEFGALGLGSRLVAETAVGAKVDVVEIVDPKEQENRHGEDLEGQAGNHDVGAAGGAFVVIESHGGNPAAGALQDERDDVAGDEDVGVENGGQYGVALTVNDHHFGQQVVVAAHDKTRGDGQANDLSKEMVLVVGAVVGHCPWAVADSFEKQAKEEGHADPALLVPYGKKHMDEPQEGKEHGEGQVTAKGRNHAVQGPVTISSGGGIWRGGGWGGGGAWGASDGCDGGACRSRKRGRHDGIGGSSR